MNTRKIAIKAYLHDSRVNLKFTGKSVIYQCEHWEDYVSYDKRSDHWTVGGIYKYIPFEVRNYYLNSIDEGAVRDVVPETLSVFGMLADKILSHFKHVMWSSSLEFVNVMLLWELIGNTKYMNDNRPDVIMMDGDFNDVTDIQTKIQDGRLLIDVTSVGGIKVFKTDKITQLNETEYNLNYQVLWPVDQVAWYSLVQATEHKYGVIHVMSTFSVPHVHIFESEFEFDKYMVYSYQRTKENVVSSTLKAGVSQKRIIDVPISLKCYTEIHKLVMNGMMYITEDSELNNVSQGFNATLADLKQKPMRRLLQNGFYDLRSDVYDIIYKAVFRSNYTTTLMRQIRRVQVEESNMKLVTRDVLSSDRVNTVRKLPRGMTITEAQWAKIGEGKALEVIGQCHTSFSSGFVPITRILTAYREGAQTMSQESYRLISEMIIDANVEQEIVNEFAGLTDQRILQMMDAKLMEETGLDHRILEHTFLFHAIGGKYMINADDVKWTPYSWNRVKLSSWRDLTIGWDILRSLVIARGDFTEEGIIRLHPTQVLAKQNKVSIYTVNSTDIANMLSSYAPNAFKIKLYNVGASPDLARAISGTIRETESELDVYDLREGVVEGVEGAIELISGMENVVDRLLMVTSWTDAMLTALFRNNRNIIVPLLGTGFNGVVPIINILLTNDQRYLEYGMDIPEFKGLLLEMGYQTNLDWTAPKRVRITDLRNNRAFSNKGYVSFMSELNDVNTLASFGVNLAPSVTVNRSNNTHSAEATMIAKVTRYGTSLYEKTRGLVDDEITINRDGLKIGENQDTFARVNHSRVYDRLMKFKIYYQLEHKDVLAIGPRDYEGMEVCLGCRWHGIDPAFKGFIPGTTRITVEDRRVKPTDDIYQNAQNVAKDGYIVAMNSIAMSDDKQEMEEWFKLLAKLVRDNNCTVLMSYLGTPTAEDQFYLSMGTDVIVVNDNQIKVGNYEPVDTFTEDEIQALVNPDDEEAQLEVLSYGAPDYYAVESAFYNDIRIPANWNTTIGALSHVLKYIKIFKP